MDKAYVVVIGRFATDLHGVLVVPGEVLGGHISSNIDWLRHDLTERKDLKALLEERFPDGYEVVVVGEGDPIPEPIKSLFSAPVVDEHETPERQMLGQGYRAADS